MGLLRIFTCIVYFVCSTVIGGVANLWNIVRPYFVRMYGWILDNLVRSVRSRPSVPSGLVSHEEFQRALDRSRFVITHISAVPDNFMDLVNQGQYDIEPKNIDIFRRYFSHTINYPVGLRFPRFFMKTKRILNRDVHVLTVLYEIIPWGVDFMQVCTFRNPKIGKVWNVFEQKFGHIFEIVDVCAIYQRSKFDENVFNSGVWTVDFTTRVFDSGSDDSNVTESFDSD